MTRNRSLASSSKAPRWLVRAAQDAAEIIEAVPDVVSMRTVRLLIPTAVYMLTRVTDLYLIVRALDIQSISFLDIMSVYSVMVVVNIIIPGKSEVGLLEATGMGSLRAYGMRASEAALAMLAWRLLASGLSILMSGAILIALRVEAQLRPDPTTPDRAPAGSTDG